LPFTGAGAGTFYVASRDTLIINNNISTQQIYGKIANPGTPLPSNFVNAIVISSSGVCEKGYCVGKRVIVQIYMCNFILLGIYNPLLGGIAD
jgi:hypothetical protein